MSISLTISISLYFWLKCFFCLMWTSMYLLLGDLCQFLCFLRQHSFKIQPFQTALTLSSTRVDAWLELYWMPLRGFHPFCASLPRPLLSWRICPSEASWLVYPASSFHSLPQSAIKACWLQQILSAPGYIHGQFGGHVRRWLLLCLLLGAPEDYRAWLRLAEHLRIRYDFVSSVPLFIICG